MQILSIYLLTLNHHRDFDLCSTPFNLCRSDSPLLTFACIDSIQCSFWHLLIVPRAITLGSLFLCKPRKRYSLCVITHRVGNPQYKNVLWYVRWKNPWPLDNFFTRGKMKIVIPKHLNCHIKPNFVRRSWTQTCGLVKYGVSRWNAKCFSPLKTLMKHLISFLAMWKANITNNHLWIPNTSFN